VFVTDEHLGVALEYAAGGELFDTVAKAGKLPEIEARYFFQQLILGLEYCHNRVGSRW
jgi:serine/threonine-protein kinase SRK2